MQELSVYEIDDVAGGNRIVGFLINVAAGVIGNAVYAGISGMSLGSGGFTNSNTDALGNMS